MDISEELDIECEDLDSSFETYGNNFISNDEVSHIHHDRSRSSYLYFERI